MKFLNLTQLYQHLDDLVCQNVCADELFASSYIRGFIALEAGAFGDESQALTSALATSIEEKLKAARTELSPQDRKIVQNYWQQLKQEFL